MLSIVLLAVLAAPEPGAPSGIPPEQAVAVIDGDGNLRITTAAGCYGPATQEMTINASEKQGTEKVPVKVRLSSVTLSTAELPAKYVDAYTVDGQSIKREKLAEMLSKEHTVLVAVDGKKVDPFLLQLYKEGTIVLVPPANTRGGGPGQFIGVEPLPPSPILPPGPVEKPKPLPDEKKP